MSILRKKATHRNTRANRKTDRSGRLPMPVLNAAPVAARKLAMRFGISIDHAIIVARLAGLGDSEVR